MAVIQFLILIEVKAQIKIILVYTLTFLLNLGRLDRICYVDQFIMAYGGLRGGIAFSLCQLTCLQNVPAIKNMLCATIIAVFFTSFVQVRAHRKYTGSTGRPGLYRTTVEITGT